MKSYVRIGSLLAALALAVSACGGGGGGGSSSVPAPIATSTPIVTPPPPSTSTMHDNDGHGTNVAGIAAGNTNNALGFADVGYTTPLMVFKVFPDPPSGGCPPGSTLSACQASEQDEVNGINDAVKNGAKVINLSLGSTPNVGQTCAQAAPLEAQATANAIAAGVVVVAASGNESLSRLDCPAGDPGVIAVGASALDDSNPAAIGEKVAIYSNYVGGSSTWGVVAPGGDPSNNDPDDLHWIENITSSTATTKTCTPDYESTTGIADCRVLIAGTSQATPHVTGAVALLLSVNPALTPSDIAQILCNTAVKFTDTHSGCGRLNVYRAMASVVGDPIPIPSSSLLCTTAGAPQSLGRLPEGPLRPSREPIARRSLARIGDIAPQYVPNQVVVIFARGRAPADLSPDSEIARSVGGRVSHRVDFRALGKSAAVLDVPADEADAAVRTLEQNSSVEIAYRPRYRRLLSTTAVIPSDPYFKGFPGANTPPLYEAPSVPGQWDMHVICAANAWGYSQSNSTGTIFPGAIGSARVKAAIVDTGADLTHPELSGGKVVYAETDLNGSIVPNVP